MPSTTIAELLRQGRERLAGAEHQPSTREAALLLGYVLGLGEASVLARGEQTVAERERRRFEVLLARRLAGEPAAYLLGEREFYGRTFAVDSRVLIPRPETEHLVEAALALDLGEAPFVLDVGTGSGAIAVTLALELPGARVVASDLSMGALLVAARNVERHGVGGRVLSVRGDLAAGLRLGRFDLVVSNPPYIDPQEQPSLSPEVRDFEPHEALFAPERGRGVLTRLLAASKELRPGTPMLLEIGYDQSEWLYRTIDERLDLELVDIRRDYGGVPRSAVLRRAYPPGL